MANIIQAGKWLREGKKVRISTWLPGEFVFFKEGSRELLGVFTKQYPGGLKDPKVAFVLCVCDIESNLWEIFQWVN